MPELPGSDRPRLVVFAVALSGIVVALVQTVVAPLLPSAPRLLHTSPGTASWLVTATLMAGCIANPIFGRLGDMYGKRRMILWSLALLVVGSLMCAATSSIAVLIFGRSLQGTALAVIPLAISILRDELPADRVPGAVATVSATLGAGAAIGYPVAALSVEFANWHTMFWVTAAVSAVILVMIWRLVPESANRSAGKFDLVGAIGLSLALGALLLGVERGSEWGWLSWPTWSCLTATLAVGWVWRGQQLRRRWPLVDLRVSAHRPVLLANLASLSVGFAFYANALSTAQLVQEPTVTGYGLGKSILVAGLCVLPGGLAMLALSPVSALLARARGPAVSVEIGCVLMAGGYLMRILMRGDLPTIVVGTSVISCGAAMTYSALSLLIMQAVPVTETAAANGLNTLMRAVGQSVCSAFTAASLTTLTMTIGGRRLPTLHAYQLVYLVAALFAVASGTLAFFAAPPSSSLGPRWMRERRRSTSALNRAHVEVIE